MPLLPFASGASSIGGSIASGTTGSVLFVGAGPVFAQDNANLFWDATNHHIGIGTATPGTGLLYGALATKVHIYDGTLAISAIQSPGAALFYAESAGGNALLGLADTAATSNFRILDILSSGGKMIFRRLRDDYGLALSNGMCIDYTNDSNGRFGIGTTSPTATLSVAEKMLITSAGLLTKYNNVTAVGWGVPAIYGSGRSAAQTGAVASVTAYTVGSADGSFLIMANVNVTTSTAHSFTVTCAYTDETNTARTLTLSFIQIGGGTPIATITNVTGAGPYEGVPNHIRCKASTSITIATTGTFTTVTYNVEGIISQIA